MQLQFATLYHLIKLKLSNISINYYYCWCICARVNCKPCSGWRTMIDADAVMMRIIIVWFAFLCISLWRTHNGCACSVANAIPIDWIFMMCCVMYADGRTYFIFLYCLVRKKCAALLLHLQSQCIALSSLTPFARKVHKSMKIMRERSPICCGALTINGSI